MTTRVIVQVPAGSKLAVDVVLVHIVAKLPPGVDREARRYRVEPGDEFAAHIHDGLSLEVYEVPEDAPPVPAAPKET